MAALRPGVLACAACAALPASVTVGRVALMVALGLALPAALAQDSGVEWSQGRLSVKANKQPLSLVLKQIQARTGIVIKSNEPLSEPVARGVERVPLVAGLHQLLSNHNHMIVEAQGRRPMRVFVLGRGQALPGRPPATLAALSPQEALTSADPAARVEAIERLADLGDASSLAALREALHDPEEAVRAVAQQALSAREGRPAPQSNKSFR